MNSFVERLGTRRLPGSCFPARLLAPAVLVVGILVSACSDPLVGSDVTIDLLAASPRIGVGDTLAVVAQAYRNVGPIHDTLHWVTSDPSVLGILRSGSVLGAGLGPAQLTVSYGVASRTLSVLVGVRVAAVRLEPPEATLSAEKCNDVTLIVGASDSAGNNIDSGRAIRWSSSDSLVARVSSDGKLSPVNSGHARISARVGNAVGSSLVHVEGNYKKRCY